MPLPRFFSHVIQFENVDCSYMYCFSLCATYLSLLEMPQVEWSIGAIRNLRIYHLNRQWLKTRVRTWIDSVHRPQSTKGMTNRNIKQLQSKLSGDKNDTSSRHSEVEKRDPYELEYDLHYFLRHAEEKRVLGVEYDLNSNDREHNGDQQRAPGQWLVQGCYRLTAKLRKTRSKRILVKMQNDWNTDHEPGFDFSNDIVYRKEPKFLVHKQIATTNLIKAMLGAIPNNMAESHIDGAEVVPRGFWEYSEDLELDSNTIFIMRGKTAEEDPGLNVLFTGTQLHAAMKHMTRRKTINRKKMSMVINFFMWPLGRLLKHMKLYCGSGGKLEANSPVPIIMTYLRRTTGKSPRTRTVLHAISILWAMLVFLLVCQSALGIGVLHSLEPLIALMYYIWASFFLAIKVSNEVARLPGDNPFDVAYKKAELSIMKATLTRLEDGQVVQVASMGLCQMCCWLHDGEEEEEEEEEEEDDGEEEADPFHIGRSTLDLLWEQSEPSTTLPFIDPETAAKDVIYGTVESAFHSRSQL